MRSSALRIALLAASAPALAACDGKDDDARRAADSFNGGNAPIVLREFLDKNGAVSSCRIAVRPGRPEQQLLTVITTTGKWLQATIDPGRTLLIEDVTAGGGFVPKTEAELRKRGEACRVSADGSLTLD
jgi:hypothetical protein